MEKEQITHILEELAAILCHLYSRKNQSWGDISASYMSPHELKLTLDRGLTLI